MTALRLGVDGLNLRSDRRGMGRFARQVLRVAYDTPDISLTLIAKQPELAAAYSAILERDVRDIVTPKQARARPFDVLWYPWNGMRFAHAAPKLVTIHDVFAFTEPNGNPIARLREQQPVRRAVSYADCVVTVSRWSAGEIARTFGMASSTIRIISHAPEPFWVPVRPPASRLQYFLFISGPERRKNAPLLFAAFRDAFSARQAELIVAGTLSETDRELLDRIGILFRHVHPDDGQLRTLYSGALAVAVPSLTEGFGLAAVEAMACGTAVLASNAAALPEACGEGAQLLDPYDRSAWSAALRRVFDDAVFREELRNRALRRQAQFDSAAPARETLALLREIADLKRYRQFHASAL